LDREAVEIHRSAGFMAEVWQSRPPISHRCRYLLLLRDDPSKFASLSSEEMQRVIQKYSTWSAGLARAGQIVSGDKLTDPTATAASRAAGERLRVIREGATRDCISHDRPTPRRDLRVSVRDC
jgi:hypothetical protein